MDGGVAATGANGGAAGAGNTNRDPTINGVAVSNNTGIGGAADADAHVRNDILAFVNERPRFGLTGALSQLDWRSVSPDRSSGREWRMVHANPPVPTAAFETRATRRCVILLIIRIVLLTLALAGGD